MEKLRHYSYTEPGAEGDRKVGFTVGKPACKNQTTISSIEQEVKDWFIETRIYVNDDNNSETIWKLIITTPSNISVYEYDWKQTIECKR